MPADDCLHVSDATASASFKLKFTLLFGRPIFDHLQVGLRECTEPSHCTQSFCPVILPSHFPSHIAQSFCPVILPSHFQAHLSPSTTEWTAKHHISRRIVAHRPCPTANYAAEYIKYPSSRAVPAIACIAAADIRSRGSETRPRACDHGVPVTLPVIPQQGCQQACHSYANLCRYHFSATDSVGACFSRVCYFFLATTCIARLLRS